MLNINAAHFCSYLKNIGVKTTLCIGFVEVENIRILDIYGQVSCRPFDGYVYFSQKSDKTFNCKRKSERMVPFVFLIDNITSIKVDEMDFYIGFTGDHHWSVLTFKLERKMKAISAEQQLKHIVSFGI